MTVRWSGCSHRRARSGTTRRWSSARTRPLKSNPATCRERASVATRGSRLTGLVSMAATTSAVERPSPVPQAPRPRRLMAMRSGSRPRLIGRAEPSFPQPLLDLVQEAGDLASQGLSPGPPDIRRGVACVARGTAASQVGQIVTEIPLAVKTLGWNGAHTSSPPNSAIQTPVLNGLGNVLGANGLLWGEIGDRAGDLQDAIVRAGPEPQPLHRGLQEALPLPGRLTIAADLFGAHRRIVKDLALLEALGLDRPGPAHPLPNRG